MHTARAVDHFLLASMQALSPFAFCSLCDDRIVASLLSVVLVGSRNNFQITDTYAAADPAVSNEHTKGA